MPKSTYAPPTVTIIYPFIAHYRLGVFRALMQETSVHYSFVTGARSRDESIPVAGIAGLQPLRRIKNVWLGPFLLQPYVLFYALSSKSSATILVGDVRYLSTWIASVILRVRGRPVIFWTIGWHRPERGLKRVIRVCFYRLATSLLLYGETARVIGTRMGYPPGRMIVIGNSHDIEVAAPNKPSFDESDLQKAPDQAEWDYLDCSHVVGAVARPTSNKRLDLLIHAVHALRARGHDVGVIIVGEGPCRESLRKLASTLEVPASLLGPIYSSSELQHVYDRIIVSVVPEAVGLTAIQSLWYGRPVITCDDVYRQMPEHEAIRPGVTGDFYATGDVEDLADVIERWISSSESDTLHIAKDCKNEVTRRWTAKAHADRITHAIVDSSLVSRI